MTGATTNRRVTTSIIAGLALVALIVHLLTIHRYGYFRDELYYIACARHVDFGYVDLAPLSAFLLRIELILFGSSLFALRIFPALASALTIVFTGILTRELGGRAWAIALACTSMLGSLFFLAVGNFYSPNVYEPLFWTARFTCSAELLTAHHLASGSGSVSSSASESKTSTPWSFVAWQSCLRFC
jgi:4-amino-4-deoxy-L-arabinose transferase-like glycosyltransferase